MIAYFDCQSGVSGDMILGALIDAGLPLSQLQATIDQLGIHAELRHERVMRCGVSSSRIEVVIDGTPMRPDQEHHLHEDVISGHSHQAETDGHHHHHESGHAHTRVTSILAQIDASGLPDQIKQGARGIYHRLAEAEAQVHGARVEDVGLHEVGSADALVDIVGAVAGLAALQVDQVYVSALHCGSGTVNCAHGQYPVPVPGVLALCRDVPMVQTDVAAEMITPTGAAILTTLAQGYGRDCPPMTLSHSGYGAGGRDLPGRPNVLRVRLGEPLPQDGTDRCVLLEANIDDMSPEVFGFLFDRLLTAGARDVFVTPILMKKGRPAHLLSVLSSPPDAEQLAQIVLSETTTLGLRSHEVERRTLPRHWQQVMTPYGEVRLKVTQVGGHTRAVPEYEDCARLAREQNIPLLTVFAAAGGAFAAGQAAP